MIATAKPVTSTKGIVFFAGDDFMVQFNQDFLRAHREEYLVYLELVKKIKRRTYDDRKCSWTIPLAPDAIACIRQLVEYGLTPTKGAREQLSLEIKNLATSEAVKQAAVEANVELFIPGEHGAVLSKAMKNYQRIGARFMAEKVRSYNADEMGTGKSIQSLASLEIMNAYPALIICPVKLKKNWLAEVRKWLPHRKVSLLPNDLEEITILAYSEIHNHVNWKLASPKKKEREVALANRSKRFFFPDFMRPKAIVLDESQFSKNLDSRRTQAVLEIARSCECEVRQCLSGTPIENKPAELIAPLNFLGVLNQMGGEWGFKTRYCNAHRKKIGYDKAKDEDRYAMDTSGASNTKELHDRLSNFMIRRRKKDVLRELPDKIEMIVEVEISNADEYRRIERDVIAYLMGEQGKMLKESAIDASHLLKLNHLRQAAGRGKLDWVVDWIDTFLEGGEKFVIYAYHKDVLDGLVKRLAHHNPATILGGCTDVTREVNKFVNDPTCRVTIASIVAAGFGVNGLQGVCSHIGIYEPMWTHSKHQQAVDRLHRIGQRDCVNAYYFLAPGTIDMDLWDIVAGKHKIVSSTIDGEEVEQKASLTNLVRKLLTRT